MLSFSSWRGKFILLCAFIGGVVLVWLFVPGIPSSAPMCQLRKANAQDNPCVAQQATIAALQGLLLQSTLDHTNNQATLTVLINTIHNQPAVPTLGTPVGLPFDDKFANNHTGWDITTHDTGKATIADNKLTIVLTGSGLSLPIPGLTVSDHFYAEATVVDNCHCPSSLTSGYGNHFGFVLGNIDKSDVTSFTVYAIDKDTQHVDFYASNPSGHTHPVSSDHKGLLDIEKPVVLGLEANGNVFTFYINGQEADAVRFNPVGQQLGITFWQDGATVHSVSFTEVTVRQSR